MEELTKTINRCFNKTLTGYNNLRELFCNIYDFNAILLTNKKPIVI
jgi:hypothetical protein